MSNTIYNVVRVQFTNEQGEYPNVTADVISSFDTLSQAIEYLENRILYYEDDGWEYIGRYYNSDHLVNEFGANMQLSVEPSKYEKTII